MNQRVRELFEEQVYPNFPGLEHGLARKPNGEYMSPTLEDHWQTFQEGIELAVKECAGICYNESEGHNMAFGEHCGNVIHKHFGITE